MKSVRRELLNALLIAGGILAAAFGLKGFLLSSNFIDGGVTGVSMLLAKVTPLPLAVWLPLVNAPFVALGSLVYLVAIHKLEYFLNARMVGRQIEARAWELLLAMLLMEAVFGIAGLIAAPIYYAYLKDELAGAGWV
jgi:predicted PurR-regulated permease PerM